MGARLYYEYIYIHEIQYSGNYFFANISKTKAKHPLYEKLLKMLIFITYFKIIKINDFISIII